MSTESSSPEPSRPRLQLSVTQVVASALAAITATVGASYLGVAGTVIGAAVASVLTVVGNAVYSHSIQRATRVVPRAPIAPEPRPRRPAWTSFASACVGVFAGVLLVVTAVEVVAGRPLTDVLRDQPGSGTTVLGDAGRADSPAPQVTITITPSVVTETPTETVTGRPVTTTVTPTTTTSTTTPTAPSSPSGTPTPTGTPTPSAPVSGSPTGG